MTYALSMAQGAGAGDRRNGGESVKLFSVSRNGAFIGVTFAHDGLAALRLIQRTSGVEGRLSGGWLAEVVRSAPAIEAPKPVWVKCGGFEVLL